MPFDASTLASTPDQKVAAKMAMNIMNLRSRLDLAITQVNADSYDKLIKNINYIRQFDLDVQAIVDAGKTADIVAEIINLFGNPNVNATDLAAFRTNVNLVRDYIRSNIALFAPSYDDVDNLVYQTSPGASAKAELISLINAALAPISSNG